METQWLLSVLDRANQIASSTQLDELLDRMLDLIIEVSDARAGTLYLLDQATDELVFKVVKPGDNSRLMEGLRMSADQGIAGAAVQARQPILIADVQADPRWNRSFSSLSGLKLTNSLTFPLLLVDEPIGVVQLFNFTRPELQLVQLLGNRMASEIDKALLLQAAQQRSLRLQALTEIIGRISSSLDRQQILQTIVNYASELLNTEVCSLFLLDPRGSDLLMQVATDQQLEKVRGVRVPAGKGIIGYVVHTGQTARVDDVQQDTRFYRGIDELMGFKTCNLLAVPLRTQTVNLGKERGFMQEEIIGGLEAVNKREGRFTEEDIQLLETLANQAATVLQIAELYEDANELFVDVVRSLAAAIDAKDPYTKGHSQRVSDFSAAIAQEMGLGPEAIYTIRIAGLLHDVGKIGVPDIILNKPGRLDEQEYEVIKKHPGIGEQILKEVVLLQTELLAIAQHHERMDGSGYPRQLVGETISLPGRIVAVADVFDAITSHRPYRSARPVEEALGYLLSEVGTYFDPQCVEALIRAYRKGRIHPQ